jgi:hypothetical protein
MSILTGVAGFVVELLAHDPAKVVIGRENFNNTDLQDDVIILDRSTETVISSTESYDEVLEEMSYNTIIRSPITVSIFGDNAQANAYKLQTLIKSEVANQYCMANQIKVYNASGVQRIQPLQGANFNERYDVVFQAQYNHTEVVSILKIDIAQTSIIVNK